MAYTIHLMRHIFIITLFLLSLSVFGQAGALPRGPKTERRQERQEEVQQRRAERKLNNKENRVPNGLERIKLIKTAYITKKLDLTSDQSAKFWPLYNKYQEEMFAVQRQIRLNNSPLQTNGTDQIMNKLALDEKKTTIERYYVGEFLKIMPPEKLSLMYKSEKDFNDEALRNLKESRNEANN